MTVKGDFRLEASHHLQRSEVSCLLVIICYNIVQEGSLDITYSRKHMLASFWSVSHKQIKPLGIQI